MRKFRTQQARKRARVLLALRTAFFVFVAGGILGLFAYGTHSPLFRVQTITLSTNGALSQQELSTAIRGDLSGTYLGLIPRDSILFLSPRRLEASLLARFPRLSNAQVRRTSATTLNAVVTERNAAALWCGDVVPPIAYEYDKGIDNSSEEVWGTCYLMDNDGYLYARAPIFTGNVFLRYYGSLTNADPIGQHFIPLTEFSSWQQVYNNMRSTDHALKAMLFVDERDIELYVAPGLRVLAQRNVSPELTQRRLTALLDSEAIDSSKKVQYLDLRFGTKAYARYIDAEQ